MMMTLFVLPSSSPDPINSITKNFTKYMSIIFSIITIRNLSSELNRLFFFEYRNSGIIILRLIKNIMISIEQFTSKTSFHEKIM